MEEVTAPFFVCTFRALACGIMDKIADAAIAVITANFIGSLYRLFLFLIIFLSSLILVYLGDIGLTLLEITHLQEFNCGTEAYILK
ncbi:MAG: hypothetical protein SAK29_39820 [Scytonema sp. PMC 1069.18]|nr:hypothetical protein [Scytonema sp. PMC 1069.18]MEC4887096.1 hypothetical protein [Scytonema sp. PMC 1070.18]